MTVFERIKDLTKKHSKTMKQVTQDLDFSENYFYSLKSGKQPSAQNLEKIADYFGVSVDYLLGRSNKAYLDPEDSVDTDSLGTDLTGYFRINTANIDPDDAEEIEEELKDYLNYLVSKVEEKKKRKK